LKFNHPEVLNSIGAQMLSELTDAVSQIAAPDSGVRCVLLTGEGRGFCAGANICSGRQSLLAIERPLFFNTLEPIC